MSFIERRNIKLEKTIMKMGREKEREKKTRETTFLIPCGEFRAGGNERRKSVVLLAFLREKEKDEEEERMIIRTSNASRAIYRE